MFGDGLGICFLLEIFFIYKIFLSIKSTIVTSPDQSYL